MGADVTDHWEPSQAIVLEVHDIQGVDAPRHSYLLEAVASDDHASFRATDEDPAEAAADFVPPRVSELVDVEVDWSHKDLRLIRDAPGRTKPAPVPESTAEAEAEPAQTSPHAAPTIIIGPHAHIVIDPKVKFVISPGAKIIIDPSAVIEHRPVTSAETHETTADEPAAT